MERLCEKDNNRRSGRRVFALCRMIHTVVQSVLGGQPVSLVGVKQFRDELSWTEKA